MKTYCYISDLTAPYNVLNSPGVHGISIALPVSVLFNSTGGFNTSYITTLVDAINHIASYGKEVTLAFEWGNKCGRAIHDNYKCLQFVRKASQNPNNPSVPVKIPSPFESNFITKLHSTIATLSTELQKHAAYASIKGVKITGFNEVTAEERLTGADFTNTTDKEYAYILAAQKWLNESYTVQDITKLSTELIDLYFKRFPSQDIIFPYIPKLNGFPTIDSSGQMCLPNERPDIKATIINHGKTLYSNFKPQFTAFDLNVSVPDYTTHLQLNRKKLADTENPVTEDYFKAVLTAAEPYQYLEVFTTNITTFPHLFY